MDIVPQYRNSIIPGLIVTVMYSVIVPSLLKLYATMDHNADRIEHMNSFNTYSEEVYDFIVVGAGSAGSVVANRLSKEFNVLLLERDGEPSPLTAIPILALPLLNSPETDYMYKTVGQKSSCLSLNNRQSSWSRGKGLGGSSNLNFMIYLRGHSRDYDNWANITGDERWSYKNIISFFRKSEDYCLHCERNLNDPTFNPNYHNKGGYLTVGKSAFQNLVEEFLQASEWSGIPRTDLNAPYTKEYLQLFRCSPIILSQRNGRRCSTKIAFLDPIRHRKKLTIRKYARAYKILFREGSNEAYGIEYEHYMQGKIAYASKEVIISAGAIETPKLLMLSGIGPKIHLQSLGIKIRKNLPVGKNLQDHIGTIAGPFVINVTETVLLDRDINVGSLNEFVQQSYGPFSSTQILATSLHSSSFAQQAGDGDWPDIQYQFMAHGISRNTDAVLTKALNIRATVFKEFLDPIKGHDAFMILVHLVRPKVRGELLLASANYKDDPLLDPKYLEDPERLDMKVLVEGVKTVVNMSENAPSFAALGSRLSPMPLPPCKYYVFRSDDYWECFIRHISMTIYHPAGTAAMGKKSSSTAVVDSELRVIGMKRLRVIDASVMPVIVSANTNGPTIMIGERGAQFIIDTWKI